VLVPIVIVIIFYCRYKNKICR